MSNFSEVISGKNVYGDFDYWFIRDRFNKTKQAISLFNEYLKIPLIYLPEDFSISVWINLNLNSTYTTVINFGYGSPTNNIWLGFHNTVFIVNNYRGNKKSYITGMSLNLNEWYHIAFVLNRTKGYVYVNGKMRSKKKHMLEPFDSPRDSNYIGDINLGQYSESSVSIDEIKLYKGSLTSSQILKEYFLTEELTNSTTNPKQTFRNELIYFSLIVILILSILVAGMI